MTKTFEEVAQSELEQATNTYEAYQGRFKSEVPDGGLVVRTGDQILRFLWIEFAKNWHSDEEFQKLKEELEDTRDALGIARNSRDEFEREYRKLKYEQQPLPEVPEFVAEEIERLKQEYGTLRVLYSGNVAWLNNGTRYLELPEIKLAEWVIAHENTFEKAWINGYTVQKPKRFYLKNKITGMYLFSDGEEFYEQHKNHGCKLTQEEIDSMDAGSYEKIEVSE